LKAVGDAEAEREGLASVASEADLEAMIGSM